MGAVETGGGGVAAVGFSSRGLLCFSEIAENRSVDAKVCGALAPVSPDVSSSAVSELLFGALVFFREIAENRMVDALCTAPGRLSSDSSDVRAAGPGDEPIMPAPVLGVPLPELGGGGDAHGLLPDAGGSADSLSVVGGAGGLGCESALSSSFVMYQAGGV